MRECYTASGSGKLKVDKPVSDHYKSGGAIIAVSECSDGLPAHANYKDLLRMRPTPQELLTMIEAPDFALYDQWQAQSQALVQRKADMYLYSSLAPDVVRDAMLLPTNSVEGTLSLLLARYRPETRVAVLPEGSLTVPCLRIT
jgi:lactate racemase